MAIAAIVLIVLFGAALLVLLSGVALYARLARLRAAVEASRAAIADECPGLNADANLHELQLGRTELQDNIRDALQSYNALVNSYNTEIGTFPSSIIAALFKFNKDDSVDLE